MKILVLGASGMIGNYLVPHLINDGFQVIATDHVINNNRIKYFSNIGVTYHQVDITRKEDFEELPKHDIDAVIHLSGIMPAVMNGYTPEKYFMVNAIGTLNLLEYCRAASIKQIIYTTSHSDMAGYWNDGKAIDPYLPPKYVYGNDHSIYSVSKRAAVEIIKNAYMEFGLEYTVFRCPNIYAWNSPNEYYVNGIKTIVGWKRLIAKALFGERLEIWGNAKLRRDLVYIKDLLQMITLALRSSSKNNIFNVSTGVDTSLEEQIITIARIFNPANKKSEIVYCPDKKNGISSHHYDITNAIEILGYRPRYFVREMFEDIKYEMLGSCIKI